MTHICILHTYHSKHMTVQEITGNAWISGPLK